MEQFSNTSRSTRPSNAQPLLQLWETFGQKVDLFENEWDELKPLLDRLPPLALENPRIDRAAAEKAIAAYLRGRGEGTRAVRWFSDATSARAHHPALTYLARPAFPMISIAPSAFSDAWYAGDPDRSADYWKWAETAMDMHRELAPRDGRVTGINSVAALLELFAAGVFYYWLGPAEVFCVERPSLRVVDGRLHRAYGPAVEWPTGESHFFWHGVKVPRWFIECPERITAESIRAQSDDQLRRTMMLRFGMERLPLMERWDEWRKCRQVGDFAPFAASGLCQTFRAIPERVTAHAEAVINRLDAVQFQGPRIDKTAVAGAIGRYLGAWGKASRPLSWFEDSRSARAHVGKNGLPPLQAAYWPRLHLAVALDSAWQDEKPGRSRRSSILDLLHGDLQWWDWPEPETRLVSGPRDDPERHIERLENWVTALNLPDALRGQYDVSAADIAALTPDALPLALWTPLMDAFAAGLFCFSIASEEVICIPRPSLWIADGQLHRADGPAVAWSSGEAHYFWRGTAVPSWVIEEPERITPQTIDSESNVELRRCLIERFGHERYLRVRGAVIVHEDQYGRLWRLEIPNREPSTMVEVENGTTDPDGTRRRYFLRVPPSMRSAREAVAWTYGLPPEQYKVAART